jgi:hypothetical protein
VNLFLVKQQAKKAYGGVKTQPGLGVIKLAVTKKTK